MRKQNGNTLALVAVAIGGLVLLVAMFAIFYSQLLGTHKEAATAIDAAALEAAKDMSRIVVDGPLGRIALVDDPSGDSSYPVLGINTVAATLRIDAIIANKLGNTTMLYLVDNDATLLNKAVEQLQTRIKSSASNNSGAFDKYGKSVAIKSDAYNAFINNGVKLSGTDKQPENFQVAIGAFVASAGTGTTQTPTPSPASVDDTNYTNNNSYMVGQTRYYRPNVDIPLPGLTKSVRFAAIGPTPTLASQADFGQLSSTDAPVVAQVSCDQPVGDITKKTGGTQLLHVIATAQVGGRTMVSGHTSASNIGFNGGFPDDTPKISFKSVQSIMNASQLDPTKTNPTSPYSGWDKNSVGKWYVPQSGDFGGGNNNLQSLAEKPFKNISGKTNNDDPSVALAFVMYDWLKTLGPRPNMKSVIDALSYDLKANPPSSPKIFTDVSSAFYQPVYAAAATNCAASTPVLTVFPGMAADDPRSLENFYKDPVAYERQQINMWKYTPADGNVSASAIMALKGCDGKLTTADGFSIVNLQFFLRDLIYTDWAACEQYNRAINLMDKGILKDPKVKELTAVKNDLIKKGAPPAEVEEVERKIDGAKFASMGTYFDNNPIVFATIVNTTYIMEVCHAIVKNMKVLTGGGVHAVPPVSAWVPYEQLGHYILAGGHFYPKTFNYNLMGVTPGPVSNGVSYLGTMPKIEGGYAVSKVNVYKRESDPIIGSKIPEDRVPFVQPVLAQSSQPPFSLFNFSFQIANPGDPIGQQNVQIVSVPADTYATVPTPKGQFLYQNLTAFGETTTPGSCVPEVLYQVQAKDLAASAYLETNGEQASRKEDAAHYFTEYGSHPNLSAAWSVSCPIVHPSVECWMPKLNLTYHGFYHGIAGEKAVTVQQVSQGTNAQAICAPFFGSSVDPNGYTVHTKWGDFKSRTFVETTYCIPLPLPWHT